MYQKEEKNKDIYEKNFNNFFIEHKKALLLQDYFLDTPLHKIAKLRNKKIFLEIFKKFDEIGILNENILNISNIENKTCLDYIINNIYENFCSLVKNNEHMKYKLFITN